MDKNKTLVIMAAGMGSRFGGLKQIEPIGPNGEFIIDYSIYDAIKAGFNRVVFIIKEENFDIFKGTVGNRVSGHIKVDYVFQKIDNIPEGFTVPEGRVKPWGTSHAIMSCCGIVNEDFIVINSDDFYGRDAFVKASKFLEDRDKEKLNEYAIIGYNVAHTLTENGSVKRGVCEEENGYLTSIIESSIEKVDGKIIASPLDGRAPFEVEADSPVSMNCFAFTKDILDYMKENFAKFLNDNKDNLDKCEYLLPDSVFSKMKEGTKVRVVPTTAKWFGVTYKEDKPTVVNAIRNMIDSGEYPENLWK
ncbi:MAG: nucleotidyltransferase [Bacilli bacterium]|nr:nucleotidyltransferase [Bacilli bacterium]